MAIHKWLQIIFVQIYFRSTSRELFLLNHHRNHCCTFTEAFGRMSRMVSLEKLLGGVKSANSYVSRCTYVCRIYEVMGSNF